MKTPHFQSLLLTAGIATIAATVAQVDAAPPDSRYRWDTVVNKNDEMPNSPTGRTYNSFNQPSVNTNGLVVFRARSRGGQGEGPPTRGIYIRDMSRGDVPGSEIETIAGGDTLVPDPNNLGTVFIEFPSIPRIGIDSNAIATRGNHQPVWEYDLSDGTETRAGTSGVYVNLEPTGPLSELITGAAKLGAVPDFEFYAVPGVEPIEPPTVFDVFPGAPAVTDDDVIAFKGNYVEDQVQKTGVFYRELVAQEFGGPASVELIASSDTPIPNLLECASASRDTFGSTAPPSAAVDRDGTNQMVFVGLDDEAEPNCGGIYQAPLTQPPQLTTLVALGSAIPGEPSATFSRLGEGLSYDGRFVGYWGAWGADTRTIRLYCPEEGNQDRIDFCNNTGIFAPDQGDQNSICDDMTDDAESCYQEMEVPVNQGIFLYDVQASRAYMVARTGGEFDDFVYWVYSGRVPGAAEGDDEDGEPARWRSSAFVAVSGRGAGARIAFKARTGELDDTHVYVDPLDGIYLGRKPGNSPVMTVLDTNMDGQDLDPEAPAGLSIAELGIERDGFRGQWLAISARMGEEDGEEEDSMAGIYITKAP